MLPSGALQDCVAGRYGAAPVNMMSRKIDRIICPVDLTVGRGAALRYAFTLAHSFDAQLLVCHCAPDAPAAVQPEIHKALNDAVTGALGFSVGAPGTTAEAAWEPIVIEANDPAQGITNEAARRAADLIVMCSRRKPLRHALLGSVAEAVCRTAPCPVLVTHPHGRARVGAAGDEVNLRRVLVAHDFSDYSELALQYAIAFAQEFRAELHLLHALPAPVREPELSWTASSTNNLYHKTARELHQAIPAEAHRWSNVTTAVRWGKPFREALGYAKEREIDLITMGAHGTGFGTGTLFGSNTDRVLRQAGCPVLVARPLKPEVRSGKTL